MKDLKKSLLKAKEVLGSSKGIKGKNSFNELLDCIECIKEIKRLAEKIGSDLNDEVLALFYKSDLTEYEYKDKLVKTAWVSKYNCQDLADSLPDDIKRKLSRFQKLHLNKTIIDKGIEMNLLKAESIEDYIKAGLVKKKTKRYIRFCDPAKEEERVKKLDFDL